MSSSGVGFGEAVAAVALAVDTVDNSGGAFTVGVYAPTAMMNMGVSSTEL